MKKLKKKILNLINIGVFMVEKHYKIIFIFMCEMYKNK